ncbi:MAG TPA: apolipoprotein N-acyltransferase [Pirellulales bacterium]|jgi:apolipoprotein N-acyltransferase|nr:apolipoprotein N-acyltransferase [Pirellulales bacterium]
MDPTPIATDDLPARRAGASAIRVDLTATGRSGGLGVGAGRWRSPLAMSLLGVALLWAALPPLDFWPLAWLTPVPWIALAERRHLSERRPYFQIWLAAFVFWLAALYWLLLPHWATSLGWLALSFYLALYLPVFVGLVRVAIHNLRLPVLAAAPLVYLGLEMARAHLMTGFSMTGLGHSQYRWTALAQIADLAGVGGIGAVMVLVAAALARTLPGEGRKIAWWPLLPAAAVLGLCLGYGHWRLAQQPDRPGPKVALIQGSIDITMKMDERQRDPILKQYADLTAEAVARAKDLDLIVWPETMFRGPPPWFVFEGDSQPPAAWGVTAREAEDFSRAAVRYWTGSFGVPILLGIDTMRVTPDATFHYNSALYFDQKSQPKERYDKVHRVMFGEYVPLADWFPWLYGLTPLPGGLNAGSGPVAMKTTTRAGPVCFGPDICFESTLSHLIRNQVETLRRQGAEPDVLVNLTNDGWFWGSSELEMHLACGVFRAIECRKPLLIAANTGISAWIDSGGQVLAQGPKRATDVIIATPALDGRRSPYLVVGDWPAGFCLAFCIGLAWIGWRRRRQR